MRRHGAASHGGIVGGGLRPAGGLGATSRAMSPEPVGRLPVRGLQPQASPAATVGLYDAGLATTTLEVRVSAAIVVGTDGSETATRAVSKAVTLARQGGATLHIVTAYGTKPEVVPEELNWMESAGVQAETILRQTVAGIDAAGLDVETHARVGDPASVLIDVAVGTAADLIVVGNKGMTGMARFLLGSVPNKVAHHAPCDVLIVRTT